MRRKDIADILHPKSIAVVGATNDLSRGATGFLNCLLDIGYEGRIYPVNPNVDVSLGLKAYPSLTDVPETVDHVIVAVPAQAAPAVIQDAARKGVRSVHLFTAGFSEVDTREGKALQEKMLEAAQGKVRIIGPNCMGIYNPRARVAFDEGQPPTPGSAAFVSQSGGLATAFTKVAVREANLCSKVVSFGNSCDLKLTDFFEYLAEDDETKTISMYIEGLSPGEGEKFLEILKRTSPKKPVLIWKGGRSAEGARAAFSHTGAMAGPFTLWSVLARQFGAVLVETIEEMHDFIKLHRLMPAPESLRSCLVVFGGGCSVAYADVCAAEGVGLPELNKQTQEALLAFIAPMGTILKNPVDVSASGWRPNVLEETLLTVARDPQVGSIVFISQMVFVGNISARFGIDPRDVLTHQAHGVAAAARRLPIPVLCANPPAMEGLDAEKVRLHLKDELEKNAVPSFPTFERTVKALKRYHDYNRFIRALPSRRLPGNGLP